MAEKPTKTFSEIVGTLEKLHGARQFPAFIDYIRLHSFKNIADATQIEFKFPITALVGANGCGKSSVIQALYGCPQGFSLGKYWFSTKLDPIVDDSGTRPYLVYGYQNENGEEREVVKTRIKWDKKEGASQNLDYWEPSRPIKKLGMKLLPRGQRHPAIEKEVMVIDFRYQPSGFDRYFYMEEIERYHAKRRRSKQDVIRLRSASILKAFASDKVTHKKSEPVFELSADQCRTISTILGKRYRSGKILHHSFYGFWASTVVFESESLENPLRYSEANAGSGEVAVTLMVHRLSQAKEGSLVLLDEPEYSLHPGAQREVLKYLLQQSLEKRLQIVFTTHAPAMVEGLPTAAIKVFEQHPLTDKFVVHQDRNVEEAFLSIGHRIPTRAMIRVEDALAKELLIEVLKRMAKNGLIPPDFVSLVEIQYSPGGVSGMKQDIALYSRAGYPNVFTVFDGTENPTSSIDLQSITIGERTPEKLRRLLKTVTNEEIRFSIDGGVSGGRSDQIIEAIERYMEYWNARVRFLPFDIPEDEIWDQNLARRELEVVLDSEVEVESEVAQLLSMAPKIRFARLTMILCNRNQSDEILAVQTKFLKHWIKGTPPALPVIEALLIEIREAISKDSFTGNI